MVTISNFVILGIIEVYALFIVGLMVLVFYNRSLSNRIFKLREQLIKLKKIVSSKGAQSEANNASKNLSPNYVEDAIAETKKQFASVSSDPEINLNASHDTPIQTTALRHQFLLSEQNANSCSNDQEKWASLEDSLFIILEQIQLSEKDEPAPAAGSTGDFEEQWNELCSAALELWGQRSPETEENLMGLLQVINSELGYEQLIVPERKPLSEHRWQEHNKNVESLNTLKESAADNKKLISQLLSARDAAESEVTIKVGELERLQRFLNESEVCITLLEDEIAELHKSPKEAPHPDTEEMQELIQNFAKESSEMLTCIDTLERENGELRDQLDAKKAS